MRCILTVLLETTLWFVLAVTAALSPTRAWGQSYCGPVTLINFNGLNGQYPSAGVTFDSLGTMYGTTSQGGPSFNPIGDQGIFNYGLGTIWKYTPPDGLVQLFAFSGETSPSNNGYRPGTPLVIDGQGNLYGTTYYGGNDFSPNINNHFGWGTLFKYSSTGQFSVLYDFNGPDGANPIGGELLDSQGNLWGTTWQGGLGWNPTLGGFGLGTVFQYSSGGSLTNPVLFTGSNGGGNIAGGMVTDGQDNYYGTTYEGGTNGFGTLFQYNSATGQLNTLVNFTRTNGSLPAATVTLDGKGNIYGTTYQGGSHSSASNYCCGTVWKYSTNSGVLTTLVSFDGDTIAADGMFPMGGVTLDGNGNLYGATIGGGTYGDGIVYEYSSTGQLSTLVTFSGPNGSSPEGDLVFDSAGNLYGITNQGGTSGYGTVYKLTPNSGGTCSGVTLSSLTLNPTTIPNGGSSTGTVTLGGAAPSGGAVVGLSSNSSFIIVPGSVTVSAGASTATFPVTTNPFVLSNTAVVITATLGNSTVQASLTLTPGIAVSSLRLNPTSVTGGSNSTGTVTITSPAPSSGTEILISTSQNPPCSLPVILPYTVTVPAGSTSVSFTIRTTSTTSSCTAPIYAQSGGRTVSANFTVNPGGSSGPTLSSLTLNPTSVSGGSSSTGTVTLTRAAPFGGTVVSLSSSNTSVATVPSSVTVSSGKTSANFTVNTRSVSTTSAALIKGTLGSSSAQATLTVTPAALLTVTSVTLNPTSVQGGGTSQGTVTLSASAPTGGTVVTLSSGNTTVATVPSSVTVSSGRTSASFTVSTQAVSTTSTAVITATLGSSSAQASLTVTPPGAVSLSSLTLNPTSVSGGNSSTGTVTLTASAPSGGVVVTLSSGNTSVANVPSSVTVSAGSTSASFTVRTQRVSSNTSVLISGTYAGSTKSATLTVTSGRH